MTNHNGTSDTPKVASEKLELGQLRSDLLRHAVERDVVLVRFGAWDRSTRVECACIGRVCSVQVQAVLIVLTEEKMAIVKLHDIERVEVIEKGHRAAAAEQTG